MEDFQQRLAEAQANWRKAIYQESAIREASFLPITFDICGINVKHFTPYHYILLDFEGSPFISGGKEITPGHIIQFLWVVSTDFKENDSVAKKLFIEKCKDLEFLPSIEAIDSYLFDAFIDMPPVSSGSGPSIQKKPPYYSWVCNYVDTLAHEYGWTDDKIIHLPFARILQYMKAIEARAWLAAGKDPLLFNKLSEKAKMDIYHLQKEQEGKI